MSVNALPIVVLCFLWLSISGRIVIGIHLSLSVGPWVRTDCNRQGMLLDALSLKIQNRLTSKLNSCEWGWLGESFSLWFIYCLSRREPWKGLPLFFYRAGMLYTSKV